METKKLIEQVLSKFDSRAARSPRIFRCPGRVNLIGEHTDYNDGFVLPFAIDREMIVGATPRSDRTVTVEALDVGENETFNLDERPSGKKGWLAYVEGIARVLSETKRIDGTDLAFLSSVPIGAGLSSSAALEVSVGFALLSLANLDIDRKHLALSAQRAEHEFAGTKTGIMDQYAVTFGRRGHAMLIDCRSLVIKYIPLSIGDAVTAVCDTKVKHELASSEYNKRRRECELGVELLKEQLPTITKLRDVTLADFEKYKELLPEPIRSRCRHVITENARTLEAADALSNGELAVAGKLMFESHRSLRDDYEVSAPELDTLVASAVDIEGVYGSRMTGGGFGGSTVTLLDRNAFDEFRRKSIEDFKAKFRAEPDVYLLSAADGASEIATVEAASSPIE